MSLITSFFGFAPKGMVVVWLGYGPTRIELARYQAELVKDEKLIKEYEDRLVAMSYLSRAKLYVNTKKNIWRGNSKSNS